MPTEKQAIVVSAFASALHAMEFAPAVAPALVPLGLDALAGHPAAYALCTICVLYTPTPTNTAARIPAIIGITIVVFFIAVIFCNIALYLCYNAILDLRRKILI